MSGILAKLIIMVCIHGTPCTPLVWGEPMPIEQCLRLETSTFSLTGSASSFCKLEGKDA